MTATPTGPRTGERRAAAVNSPLLSTRRCCSLCFARLALPAGSSHVNLLRQPRQLRAGCMQQCSQASTHAHLTHPTLLNPPPRDRTFTNPKCPVPPKYGAGFAKMAAMQAAHDPNRTFEPELWTRMVAGTKYELYPRCVLDRTCYCEVRRRAGSSTHTHTRIHKQLAAASCCLPLAGCMVAVTVQRSLSQAPPFSQLPPRLQPPHPPHPTPRRTSTARTASPARRRRRSPSSRHASPLS